MTEAVLQIRSGSQTGRRLRVSEWPLVIGRAETCDLRLRDNQASRLHCEILHDGGGVVVRDLRSRNGTFVNEKRIYEATILNIGDHIRVGRLELELMALPRDGSRVPFDPSPNARTIDLAQMTIDELVQFDNVLALPALEPPDPSAPEQLEVPAENVGNYGTTIISGDSLKSPDPEMKRPVDATSAAESTRDAARQALRKLFHGRN